MKPDDFSVILFMGIVFGGGLVLGYKLMEALEENGYIDTQEFRVTSK